MNLQLLYAQLPNGDIEKVYVNIEALSHIRALPLDTTQNGDRPVTEAVFENGVRVMFNKTVSTTAEILEEMSGEESFFYDSSMYTLSPEEWESRGLKAPATKTVKSLNIARPGLSKP